MKISCLFLLMAPVLFSCNNKENKKDKNNSLPACIKRMRKTSLRWDVLEAWQTAINVANHRPTGAGFAMYDWATSGIYAPPGVTFIRAAHSIYFSVLGEHGYIGLSLFVLIWVLALRVAGQLRKQTRNRPKVLWVYQLAGMCQVSLVGYLVGGTFLSLAYFDLPYNILVVLVVTQRWLREGASQAAGVFGSANSSRSVETLQALK